MPDQDTDVKKNGDEKKPVIQDQIVETKHSVTLSGQEIKYTVTCGTYLRTENFKYPL